MGWRFKASKNKQSVWVSDADSEDEKREQEEEADHKKIANKSPDTTGMPIFRL